MFFKESLEKSFINKNLTQKPNKFNRYFNDLDKLKIAGSKVGSGEIIPSGLESLLVSGILTYPFLLEKNFENFELLIIDHKKLNEVRNKLITFLDVEKPIDSVIIEEFININFKDFLDNDLKFSKKYWSNLKNSTIESISSTWLEIFNDDQHIKSLDIEIGNFDKNIVDDEHEKRLLSILEQKDNELKKITEKYGQ